MSNLPNGLPGKLLALAIAALLLVSFYLIIIDPLVGWYDDGAQRLSDLEDTVARFQRSASQLPELRVQASEAHPSTPAEELLLAGTSDAVAAAALQTRLRSLAEASSVNLTSTETLPADNQGDLRRIALRLALTGSLPMVTALLQGIESSRPPLFVDNLSIRAGTGAARDDKDKALSIAMDVYGFRPQ